VHRLWLTCVAGCAFPGSRGHHYGGAETLRIHDPKKSDTEARKAARPVLLRAGRYPARITEAVERQSKAGNDVLELQVVVTASDGSERTFRDWLTASDRGAQKARNCCLAVGELHAYEAGEISAELFPGHDVQVTIGIRKQRGWPDANEINDYAAVTTGRGS
jgi:hypothetical protein